ncbi:MAG: hypothetical protein Q8L89_03415, partial [Gammaproteobacteria bacterium]|nr:hypothetical protein [Gammaproteobacteria bacterium]
MKDFFAEKVLSMLPTRAVFIEAAMRRGNTGNTKDISGDMEHEATVPIVFDLEDWKAAVASATDPKEPDRALLTRVYGACALDTTWSTATENIILKLQGLKYRMVNEKGETDEEATKLLERMWFLDFVRHTASSIHTGTKVLNCSAITAEMELDSISVIPATHVIPSQKRILKNPAQREGGWLYDSEPMSTYYFQVGKDYDLGILEKLAIIILFKKKAIGHWLDYMNKYGVPPAWVITDRQDDERFNQLFNMMKNMSSSRFAVLRGKEEIKIQQVPTSDAFQVFLEFINKMGEFIMQSVAGATGTMDVKSFVGAAKVHQDTLTDRMWFYRFLVSYTFNKEM